MATTTTAPSTRTRTWLTLLPFLVAVAAVAVVGGLAAGSAGSTYRALDLPPFAPPSWLFGPVWSVLYVMIGVAGGHYTAALVDIVVLAVMILALIALAWTRSRVAAWLLVPYAAWVCFATALNAGIVVLN